MCHPRVPLATTPSPPASPRALAPPRWTWAGGVCVASSAPCHPMTPPRPAWCPPVPRAGPRPLALTLPDAASPQVLVEAVAGSGGTVAIDDLILSPGCVQKPGEPRVALPQPSPSLKDPPRGLPVPLLLAVTIVAAAWHALAHSPACPCPAAVTLHPLCQNLPPSRRHTAAPAEPLGPLPRGAAARAGRGWALGGWRAGEVLSAGGPWLSGVTLPLPPDPLTTALRAGAFRRQGLSRPRCRAGRVTAPAPPGRWPVTAGAASEQSWPATSPTRVPTAPTRNAAVRPRGGTGRAASRAAEGTGRQRAPRGARPGPGPGPW